MSSIMPENLAASLKRLAFRPAGRLLRQAARAARGRAPGFAGKLDEFADLIDRRQYRSFVGRAARGLLRRLGMPEPARLVPVSAPEPAPAEAPAEAPAPRAWVEVAPSARPCAVVLGQTDPAALAATLESLKAQTLPAGEIRLSPGEDGLVCEPGDLVCIVAAGTRLDPTALELLAAVLLSVPGCKFAATRVASDEGATGSERIAACLIPGRIWQAYGRPALGTAQGEEIPAALDAALQGVAGQGLLLPLPLAARISTPGIGFAASTWTAIRAAPDQAQIWSSPLDGAARIEAFVGSRPARDDGDGRPHLLVVVPYLPVGGSEIVLLDVLEHVAATWAVSIVTTLPGEHAMRGAFARLTDEIYHAGDIFDPLRLQALISGLIAARATRVVLSSNSWLLHRMVPELKAMHPQTAFLDIQHNDLAHGLIRGAVAASTSLDRHIAVSRRVGEALAARGVPRERIAVVPNGIDTDLFSPQATDRRKARAALGIGEGTLLLAFVGRFSEEKRVGAFAEVVARVRQAMPVRAIAVGEGEDEASLRARIAAEDLPIGIVPKMPRPDLVGLYAAADLLVLTSVVEGMPMVVLEAMATGCPAAVTDVGDVRRIVESGVNGFVAPVGAPEALADLIVAAAREPGRLSGMRAAARAAVTGNGMTKAAMLDGYDRLLDALGRPGRAGFDRAEAAL
jgi:glycosyltransferase involved in cell wall biosynthesis